MQQPQHGERRDISWELKPGVPVAGQSGPDGARFLGWVLVQVWEPTPGVKDAITVQFSGDLNELFPAAAEHLSRMQRELGERFPS
jgi:hypothetical protein